MLAEAGLTISGVVGPQDPNARVITSTPGQGTPVDKGSGVTLVTGGGGGGGGNGGIFG